MNRFIIPEWPVPDHVHAVTTTRAGGVSRAPFADSSGAPGMNLGLNCGDQPSDVQTNRQQLAGHVGVPICWLEQWHGTDVATVESARQASAWTAPRADAAVTASPDVALAILTADCLPVLVAGDGVLGAAHAGWRGLAGGVIEQTIQAMQVHGGRPEQMTAWLGPAIGPTAFEVGQDVLDAFCQSGPDAEQHFVAHPDQAGKWLANLYGLARDRLGALGVDQISGGGFCTVTDVQRFYSYRRDRCTGRMATLIWRKA